MMHKTDNLLDRPIETGRSTGIDCLRGVLALWVLLVHLLLWGEAFYNTGNVAAVPMKWLVTLFQSHAETHPAVISFIVLSGYCIHRSGFRRQRSSMSTYAARRTFRIWPTYLLATICGGLLYQMNARINKAALIGMTETYAVTFKGLLIKLSCISALAPQYYQTAFQGNSPLATVMVEIWLYALYAAVTYFVLRRFSDILFWSSLVSLWLLALIYISYHPALQGWWHNSSLIGFALYWWIGASFVGKSSRPSAPRLISLLSLWIILSAILLSNMSGSLLVVESRKVVFAILVGSMISFLDGLDWTFLNYGAYLGRAGYSMYALHAPLVITFLFLGLSWWAILFLIIGVSLIVFKYYEAPCTQLGKRLGVAFDEKACNKTKAAPFIL